MYRVGLKPQPKKRRWPLWAGLIFGLLLLLGGFYILSHLHTKTTITQAAPVTTKITSTASALKLFSEPGFELKLPTDWTLQSHVSGEYNIYRFQGTGKVSISRQLDVYQDTTPVNLPLNRVQPVDASGPHMTANGSISDNCSDFTKAAPASGQSGSPAKWQNVDFLCDLHNTSRNVVGTSAPGGINKVTLQGLDGTPRSFFMTYFDHGLTPDYGVFYSAIETFSAH